MISAYLGYFSIVLFSVGNKTFCSKFRKDVIAFNKLLLSYVLLNRVISFADSCGSICIVVPKCVYERMNPLMSFFKEISELNAEF